MQASTGAGHGRSPSELSEAPSHRSADSLLSATEKVVKQAEERPYSGHTSISMGTATKITMKDSGRPRRG
jgi:hypothetical protein